MTPIEPKSSTTTSTGNGGPTYYKSTESSPVDKKRKPVHTAKPLSAKQIRKSLNISKKDIAIARRIVNRIRHK